MKPIAALASVTALLVCGVVAGALGMHLFEAHRRPPQWARGRPPGPPPHLDLREMEERLDLTADQSRQIAGILDRSRDESEALRLEVRPRLEKQMERTRQEIEAVLTPEQRRKFEDLRRDQRRRARRFFLGEGEPGPDPFGPRPPRRGPAGSGPRRPGPPPEE
jgi:Spy/CpxP family protein refolding chaperone